MFIVLTTCYWLVLLQRSVIWGDLAHYIDYQVCLSAVVGGKPHKCIIIGCILSQGSCWLKTSVEQGHILIGRVLTMFSPFVYAWLYWNGLCFELACVLIIAFVVIARLFARSGIIAHMVSCWNCLICSYQYVGVVFAFPNMCQSQFASVWQSVNCHPLARLLCP